MNILNGEPYNQAKNLIMRKFYQLEVISHQIPVHPASSQTTPPKTRTIQQPDVPEPKKQKNGDDGF